MHADADTAPYILGMHVASTYHGSTQFRVAALDLQHVGAIVRQFAR